MGYWEERAASAAEVAAAARKAGVEPTEVYLLDIACELTRLADLTDSLCSVAGRVRKAVEGLAL